MSAMGKISLSFYLLHLIVLECLFFLPSAAKLFGGLLLSLVMGHIITTHFEGPAQECLRPKSPINTEAMPNTEIEMPSVHGPQQESPPGRLIPYTLLVITYTCHCIHLTPSTIVIIFVVVVVVTIVTVVVVTIVVVDHHRRCRHHHHHHRRRRPPFGNVAPPVRYWVVDGPHCS
jgi:peptidoglycan/LPS O-acetylase OafA/YrhL